VKAKVVIFVDSNFVNPLQAEVRRLRQNFLGRTGCGFELLISYGHSLKSGRWEMCVQMWI